MTTYGIREFKARVSEILRNLENGEEVIITRRGKPCGKLTAAPPPEGENPALAALREKYQSLPDLEFEELQATIKGFWKVRPLPGDDGNRSLATLRGAFRDTLPAATWDDFQEIKKIWEPRSLPEFDEVE